MQNFASPLSSDNVDNHMVSLYPGPMTDELYRKMTVELVTKVAKCQTLSQDASMGDKAFTVINRSEVRLRQDVNSDLSAMLHHAQHFEVKKDLIIKPYHKLVKSLADQTVSNLANAVNEGRYQGKPGWFVENLCMLEAARSWGNENAKKINELNEQQNASAILGLVHKMLRPKSI